MSKTLSTFSASPDDYSLLRIRALVDAALNSMQGTVTVSYSYTCQPAIAQERLIWASLLQVLFSVRSERQLVEQLRYNMLYRWFVGLSLDDGVWSATMFTKNRQRFVGHTATARLLEAALDQAHQRQLLSGHYFCVGGTLSDAWASMHKPRTPAVQPKSTLDATLTMLDRRPGKRRLTVGADKNYDQHRFIEGARKAQVTPPRGPEHAPTTLGHQSPYDARHGGYAQSINARHRVDTPFGWDKFNRPLRQAMLRGPSRIGAQAKLVFTSYNRVRIAVLEAA